MSRASVRKNVLETNRYLNEKDKSSQSFLSRHLKKIYPIGLNRSNSSLSLSSLSLSLSLSQNSNDSSLTEPTSPLDHKISLALRLIRPPERRSGVTAPFPRNVRSAQNLNIQPGSPTPSDGGELRRCNWITKSSDEVYVSFHDECWGVPVYDDRQLFELLAMSGMLMDYNWTEILKRKQLYREAFAEFDPNSVAKMGDAEVEEISSNKAMMLAESRVRCIIDNAKCILKVAGEFGSFSNYMWSYVNHKPTINRFKHPRNVPLRTPKAEVISKDLQRRGFRFVGPVIVYSFMQAAGLTIDHLVDCYRYDECTNLAERPWRHI
ncbi:DNA-3-methyladenine glycosylase isoform X2 [Rhodamnia argentea]|uniref:DNA-3-methyladenine glycosylase isoform X2 n=1 Tax=Rhodamnia argentea TaxID=178133 RepID=A0A8B8MUQ3_9MYRT|nr:DNA-3-methyladenine glycosylase isoform X2 [Rhodamnia argentea]